MAAISGSGIVRRDCGWDKSSLVQGSHLDFTTQLPEISVEKLKMAAMTNSRTNFLRASRVLRFPLMLFSRLLPLAT
jgi:hypothetical protein